MNLNQVTFQLQMIGLTDDELVDLLVAGVLELLERGILKSDEVEALADSLRGHDQLDDER